MAPLGNTHKNKIITNYSQFNSPPGLIMTEFSAGNHLFSSGQLTKSKSHRNQTTFPSVANQPTYTTISDLSYSQKSPPHRRKLRTVVARNGVSFYLINGSHIFLRMTTSSVTINLLFNSVAVSSLRRSMNGTAVAVRRDKDTNKQQASRPHLLSRTRRSLENSPCFPKLFGFSLPHLTDATNYPVCRSSSARANFVQCFQQPPQPVYARGFSDQHLRLFLLVPRKVNIWTKSI